MTNEQSATLLRLNKQAQVAALNAVGFSDVTENPAHLNLDNVSSGPLACLI